MTRYVISGPPVILDNLLLAHMKVLLELCPNLCLVLDEHINDGRMRGPFIQLNLRRPSNPALISSRIGRLTYSAYAPRGVTDPAGWIGNSATVRQSVSNSFAEKTFCGPPTLMVGSMPFKITAMKTMGLAAILPDITGTLDRDLVRLDALSEGISAPIWLSYKADALERPETEHVLDWIKSCVLEANWLNVPTACPHFETALSGSRAVRYMAGHDEQYPHP
ncbi:hypothetical protein C8N43_0465 [Litoreibacter ponti]|uniref:Uncharacterized protein n=1 Tax=Litoreibacter ponti TaxID=1510457 RepID=A0A2T6BID6_9RHOB|nr:hypothetical protein [Litoreibacter ponti]PTX55819.1 hypothetical protein C8N43_0465 [Litoreibacter ponti]